MRIGLQFLVQVRRQFGICMQEQQLSRTCNAGAMVHLQGTAGVAVFNPAGITMRDLQAAIFTTSVTDDDFAVRDYPGLRKQSIQALLKAFGLV